KAVKRHKILYLDEGRQAVLSGSARSSDGEGSLSLVEVLNNLATADWQNALPVYGPVTLPGVAGYGPTPSLS
ncbi:MAG: hypothetical protein RB148_11620, partial [Armatimonadota bacterium]|nr:hypothetical protein [Armatimonadota bacterium]